MTLQYPKTHRRTKLEMILEVLEALVKIHRPTRIMHVVNSSWTKVTEYLELLVDTGFVSCVDIKKNKGPNKKLAYHLTDKGIKFLKDFKAFRKQLGELQIVRN